MTARVRALFVLLGGVALAIACGRRVELETESKPVFEAGAGGSGIVDAEVERILPDGPVPIVEDAGLSLEAGDGCAARPSGCPSTTDFPCGLTEWFSKVVSTCRERAGCIEGFLTIELAGEGCASQIGMTHVNRRFVECLFDELQYERCPCAPGVETIYLGPEC